MKRTVFCCILLMTFASVLFGQNREIIHTVCGPEHSFVLDSVHHGEGGFGVCRVYLDYDQDGNNDHVIFSNIVWSWGDIQIRINGVDETRWRLNPRPCTVGDTISCYADSLFIWPWYVLLRGWDYDYSSSHNVYTDTYYSVRKQTDDGFLYAWWRLSIVWKNDQDVTVTVHEMAYCSEPNYPFRVGQTSFDWEVTESQTPSGHSVWPNPVDDILSIRFSPDETPAIVELYDLQGRRVLTRTKALDRIPVEGLPSGTYLVRVTMDDGSIFSVKVVKK